ncbi:MAG: sodium:solute symporter [Bacteroidota bacterium]
MIHLSPADITVIFIYFISVVYIGFRAARRTVSSEEDFLLAGRSLTLPIFVMTLVSSWYGGILGVGEFSYRYGISNWVTQGLPYYIFAAVFAFLLAKRIRATNLYSIPDKLEAAYDRKTAILGSLLTFILMTPAPYVLMLSIFLQMIFGWSMLVCLIVTSIVAVSYLYLGGFRSDVHTDVFEFIIMFIGFAVILPYCYTTYGGYDFLKTHLPPLHLTWHGGNSIQYILVWFFIALWTLVDPPFHQRCYAAKDGATAQRGVLVSIIFWFGFDFMTASAGLYSRAVLPHLANPVMAYPMLAETVLPSIAKGLFFVGMIATIMSSLNALAFVSAQTLGRDIILRLRGDLSLPLAEVNRKVTLYTQVCLMVSFSASIVIGLAIPSVIQEWYTIGTVVIPGLLIPLVASYYDKLTISSGYAFAAMLLGWLTSTSWLIAGHVGNAGGSYPLSIEPMYPGLLAAMIIWGVGRVSQLNKLI